MTTVLMQAPASLPNGSIVLFADTTSAAIDATGRLACPLNSVNALENAGFTLSAKQRLTWQTGRFYAPPAEVLTAFLTIASVLYAVPIFVPSRIVVKSLSVNVTTGNAGDVGRLGIYADVNGAPDGGALIVDSGEQTLTSTAVVSAVVSVTLEPGLYWLASTFDAGGGTMPSVAGISVTAASMANEMIGSDTAAHALATATTNNATGRKKTSFTYAALPATFPAGSVVQSAADTPCVAIGT